MPDSVQEQKDFNLIAENKTRLGRDVSKYRANLWLTIGTLRYTSQRPTKTQLDDTDNFFSKAHIHKVVFL